MRSSGSFDTQSGGEISKSRSEWDAGKTSLEGAGELVMRRGPRKFI